MPQILIVEDEFLIRDNVKTLLEMEGYAVRCAANGEEALELIRRTVVRPDLILLDLLMPVMNGIEFLESLRGDPVLKTIAVCVMSGVPERPAPLAGEVFLKKPVQFSLLLDTVKRLTDRARAA